MSAPANIGERVSQRTLVWLLRRAARHLRRLPQGPIFSVDFHSAGELGDFIESSAARIADGDIAAAHELWYIFAPTCEWDDAGGSPNLGNLVFAVLDFRYRPVPRSS